MTCLQRRHGIAEYQRLEWSTNGIFGLQRLAYEEIGQGTWSKADSDVPVTRMGEMLAGLDIRDKKHPMLDLNLDLSTNAVVGETSVTVLNGKALGHDVVAPQLLTLTIESDSVGSLIPSLDEITGGSLSATSTATTSISDTGGGEVSARESPAEAPTVELPIDRGATQTASRGLVGGTVVAPEGRAIVARDQPAGVKAT